MTDSITALVQTQMPGATVIQRRPGTWQIVLPAYHVDGDPAEVYARRREDGQIVLSDLGATQMRVSYSHRITDSVEAILTDLAESQGIAWSNGAFEIAVESDALLPGALAIIQSEARAESAIVAKKREVQVAAKFRATVLVALKSLFSEHLVDVEPVLDPSGLYKIDALVNARRRLAITTVSNDISAERAVGAKLKLAHLSELNGVRWVAIPRDMSALKTQTRKRVEEEFNVPASTFSGSEPAIENRLRDWADDAA